MSKRRLRENNFKYFIKPIPLVACRGRGRGSIPTYIILGNLKKYGHRDLEVPSIAFGT